MTGDAHLHFFSRGVFGDLARQVEALAAAPDPAAAAIERLGVEPPPHEPEALAARWSAELDRHGVERALLFGSAPGEAETVARAVRARPDRFAAAQMLNPRAPGAAAAPERFAALGLRGILLLPALHELFPDDPACLPIYEAAARLRLVVIVSIGPLRIPVRERLGLAAGHPRYGDPARLAAVIERHPGVPFVVPHFGCGLLEALLAGRAAPRNLFLDTSGSNAWRGEAGLASVFRHALDRLGSERLLFGTDSTVFPRGWRREVHDAQLAALDELGAAASERAAILGGNLARLLSDSWS